MRFKLLIVEDDSEFLENLIIILKYKMSEKAFKLFDIVTAKSLEETHDKIKNCYYIGCSLDQSIPKGTDKHTIDYGVETSKIIARGNIFISSIIYTNYMYEIDFVSILGMSKETFFNKNKTEAKEWAEILLNNTQKYIDEGIFKEACKYLPLSLVHSLEKYQDIKESGDDVLINSTMIHFFELDLKMIYGSVLATLEEEHKATWVNAKMIEKLQIVARNLDSYGKLDTIQKTQLKKLLNQGFFDSLDALRQFRNRHAHVLNDEVEPSRNVYLHFVNLVLHNAYFYTNPFIYIKKTRMVNNQLDIDAKRVIGQGENFDFKQKHNPFVDEGKLYQIFDRNTSSIKCVDRYFEKDNTQKSLTIKVK